jgi:hypothetical protein
MRDLPTRERQSTSSVIPYAFDNPLESISLGQPSRLTWTTHNLAVRHGALNIHYLDIARLDLLEGQ